MSGRTLPLPPSCCGLSFVTGSSAVHYEPRFITGNESGITKNPKVRTLSREPNVLCSFSRPTALWHDVAEGCG